MILFYNSLISWAFCEKIASSLFENKILRKIYGPNRDEQRGERRKLHTVKLHNLYGNADIMTFKSRRLRWAGHVARKMEEGHTRFF